MTKLFAVLAAATMTVSAPAIAKSVAVEFDDLDLATASGQAELDTRLDKAARDVCGMDSRQTGTRMPNREAKKCYTSVKSQIEQQIAAKVAAQAERG